MLSIFKKSILFSILLLLFTACASKRDGKYHTQYSYHPYYSLYAKKMYNYTPKKKEVKSKVKKSKLSSKKKSRFPTNN